MLGPGARGWVYVDAGGGDAAGDLVGARRARPRAAPPSAPRSGRRRARRSGPRGCCRPRTPGPPPPSVVDSRLSPTTRGGGACRLGRGRRLGGGHRWGAGRCLLHHRLGLGRRGLGWRWGRGRRLALAHLDVDLLADGSRAGRPEARQHKTQAHHRRVHRRRSDQRAERRAAPGRPRPTRPRASGSWARCSGLSGAVVAGGDPLAGALPACGAGARGRPGARSGPPSPHRASRSGAVGGGALALGVPFRVGIETPWRLAGAGVGSGGRGGDAPVGAGPARCRGRTPRRRSASPDRSARPPARRPRSCRRRSPPGSWGWRSPRPATRRAASASEGTPRPLSSSLPSRS